MSRTYTVDGCTYTTTTEALRKQKNEWTFRQVDPETGAVADGMDVVITAGRKVLDSEQLISILEDAISILENGVDIQNGAPGYLRD